MACDRMARGTLRLLAVVGALCLGRASAQDTQPSQNQSVADAARQAREAKKNAAKPSKVISDDDIDTRNVKPGAEGLNVGSQPKSDTQPPNPAAISAVEATDAATAAAETNPPLKPGEDPEIAKAKEQVAEAAKRLDLLQRELALDQDSYYSKPDFASDKNGKAKLDAEQQQINDQRAEVDRLKAYLADLERIRREKKGSASQKTEAAPPETEKPAEPPPSAPPQS